MSFYVKDALDRGAPVDLADNVKVAKLGTMLYNLCTPVEAEAVTVSANVGTLAYLPSSVLGVRSTAGSTKGHIQIPAGSVPNAGEVAVNYATGALTFAAADSVTACVVTYHKCAEKANLVLDAIDVR